MKSPSNDAISGNLTTRCSRPRGKRDLDAKDLEWDS